MSSRFAIQLSSQILCLLTLVQAVEFIWLHYRRRICSIWNWEIVNKELFGDSKKIINFFSVFLSTNGFLRLNFLRAIIAVYCFMVPSSFLLMALIVIHLLTMLRWFGNYNGGSDSMYMFVLIFCCIGLSSDFAAQISVWVIAFQLCLSYFRAGWVKLKSKKWWSGEALVFFLNSKYYEKHTYASRILQMPTLARILSLGVIFFEIFFPLAILSSSVGLIFLWMGFLFHISVVYFFGLNRFLLAWLSAYPALLSLVF